MRYPKLMLVSLCILTILPLYVFAGSHPHTRNGFFVGFGLGAANAGIENGSGPEVDFTYLNVGGLIETANFVSGQLMVAWYW